LRFLVTVAEEASFTRPAARLHVAQPGVSARIRAAMCDPVVIGSRRARPRPLLRTTLGRILRRVRRQQGRTLADVARAARVSMPYLSELERGRKEASSEVLAAVCDALRIELADLLAEAGRVLAGDRARRALSEERARRSRARSTPAVFSTTVGIVYWLMVTLPPSAWRRPAGRRRRAPRCDRQIRSPAPPPR